MGFSKQRHQVEKSKESDPQTWVIAGIAIRAPLKPVSTAAVREEHDDNDEGGTTPTAREARIPARMACPAAPRKRRPNSNWRPNRGMEFFNPPDLESVFICRAERA